MEIVVRADDVGRNERVVAAHDLQQPLCVERRIAAAEASFNAELRETQSRVVSVRDRFNGQRRLLQRIVKRLGGRGIACRPARKQSDQRIVGRAAQQRFVRAAVQAERGVRGEEAVRHVQASPVERRNEVIQLLQFSNLQSAIFQTSD